MSIGAVLLIHATFDSEVEFLRNHEYVSDAFLGVLLNQWARFSVPLFIMLSGFGLGSKYLRVLEVQRGKFPYKSYLWDRVVKIAFPFLVLTPLLLFFQDKLTWPGLLKSYMLGSADYHLYFFSIIIQCYLLFPLLIRVDSRLLLAGLFLFQLSLTAPAHLYWKVLGLDVHAAFCVYWVFYFYTGIYAARHIRVIVQALRRFRRPLLLLGLPLFSLLLLDYLFRSYTNPVPGYFNHFNRWSVLFYALWVPALALAFDQEITAWIEKRPSLTDVLARGAALSFGVYIWHTWILRLLKLSPAGIEVFLLSVSLILLSFLAIFLLDRLLLRPQVLRLLLGLPQK